VKEPQLATAGPTRAPLRLLANPSAGPTTESLIAPALYPTLVRHARSAPLHHAFSYRHPMWLVDLDDVPTSGLLGGVLQFAARDHIGNAALSIRQNIVAWVAEHGLDVHSDRILMLTNARSFGYVFNPLTVFWCLRRGVALDDPAAIECIVAEVHNTYGGRHAYLVQPQPAAPGTTVGTAIEKAFYVSPFNPVDGEYDMHFSLPTDALVVTIALRRGGRPMFGASLAGRRHPATTTRVLTALLRHPMAGLRVSVLIRYQGIRLWARGLPVVRRPTPNHPNTPHPETSR
jgi:DUF1365 family protein